MSSQSGSGRRLSRGDAASCPRIDSYVERCEKGLTPREARWIIEDFIALGLAGDLRSASTGDYLQRRKLQHRWYLDLLDDGLRLDSGQRRAAMEKLAGLLEVASGAFNQELDKVARRNKPFEIDGR